MSIEAFQSAEDGSPPHTASATWQQRLDVARTFEDVADIARDFVARFTPYDLHGLPEPCRPSPKLYAEDITPLALELVRYQCAHDEMADAVQGLAPFFARASARLAQLAVYERVKAVTPAR